MIGWLRRRKTGDLRPTYAERQAALERARERLHRQQRSEARRRAWIKVGLPLLGAFSFVLGLALADRVAARSAAARPDLFVVARLEIEGTQRVDAVALARAVLPEGAPDPIAPEEVASRLEAHPWIARVAVARLAPDALVARVEEHEPVARARAIGEAPVLVTASGVAFAAAESSDWDALPLLIVADSPPRDRRDPLLAQGIDLARAVAEAGYRHIEVSLDGEDPNALPALRVGGIPARIVLGAGDPAPKLANLATVLAANPSARDAREIDLRFAEQVVLRPVVAPEMDEDGPTPGADAPGSATGVGAPRRATGDRSGESRRSHDQEG
jgi:cell division septal protein FtsQ